MNRKDIYESVFERRFPCQDHDIQENIFAYYCSKQIAGHMKSIPSAEIAMKNYGNLIYTNLINKIKEMPLLYIVKSKHTGFPYLDCSDPKKPARIWMFSYEFFAQSAVKFYQDKHLSLEVQAVPQEELESVLRDMFYLGAGAILMDNGLLHIEFSMTDFICISDAEIRNQQIGKSYLSLVENYKQAIHPQSLIAELEDQMFEKIQQGTYVMPILKESKGTTYHIPLLITTEEEQIHPVFTDLYNAKKWDRYGDYIFQIASFEDIKLIHKTSGYSFAIDPFSINIILTKKVFETIPEEEEK